jgi:relaxase
VLINLKSEDVSSRKLARYDFLKLNLPESITVEQVSEEIRAFKEELNHYLYEYERLIRILEEFVKMLNITTNNPNPKFQENILMD